MSIYFQIPRCNFNLKYSFLSIGYYTWVLTHYAFHGFLFKQSYLLFLSNTSLINDRPCTYSYLLIFLFSNTSFCTVNLIYYFLYILLKTPLQSIIKKSLGKNFQAHSLTHYTLFSAHFHCVFLYACFPSCLAHYSLLYTIFLHVHFTLLLPANTISK